MLQKQTQMIKEMFGYFQTAKVKTLNKVCTCHKKASVAL